jgi:biotin carboxylase
MNPMFASTAFTLWVRHTTKQGINIWPCVVKPVDNCGSRGVSICNNQHEFESAWELASKNNRNSNVIIVEEVITGIEYSTDWFVTPDGTPIFVNGAKRYFDRFGIEIGHVNPGLSFMDYTPEQLADRLRLVDVVKVLGVEGPLKVDFFITPDDRYVIIECATRWSGGYDHGFTAKYATGRNLEKPLLDYALGLPLDKSDFKYKIENNYCACLAYHNPNHEQVVYNLNHKLELLDKYAYLNAQDIIALPELTSVAGGAISHCAQRNLFLFTTGNNHETALLNAGKLRVALEEEA